MADEDPTSFARHRATDFDVGQMALSFSTSAQAFAGRRGCAKMGLSQQYSGPQIMDLLLGHEPAVRLSVFLGMLFAMMLWEVSAPRRRLDIPRVIRWSNNLALVVVDAAILRLAFPVLAVGLAGLAHARGWGLFNALDLPTQAICILSSRAKPQCGTGPERGLPPTPGTGLRGCNLPANGRAGGCPKR